MNSAVSKSTITANKKYLFQLDPIFISDKLDLVNQNYFPQSNNNYPDKRYDYAVYTPITNKYLENEIKGFIQHLAIDFQYSAATLKQYISQSLHMTTLFMNQYHPECNSITDIGFEALYAEYIEYLSDQNISIVSYSIHRVNAQMEQVDYPCKSHYVSGFVAFYKYIYSLVYPDTENEYVKDIWDVRNLGIKYDTAVSRKRYTVNFTCIKQPWLKIIVKEYVYYRLQCRTVASVLDDLKSLRIFSEFLDCSYSEIKSLSEINRNIIEDYFSFLNSKGFVTTTYNHRVSALRTFFNVGNMMDLDGVPSKPLIMYSDYRKTVHKFPKYFSYNELKQMNDHIGDLPIQIGRIFFVLENCGMRVSDICSSTIYIGKQYCLEKNSDNEYIFTYYMPKTRKYNTIPITEIVGNVIEEAIADSKRQYGPECKYIFAASKDTPIGVETFSLQMNNMSSKFNLKKDDGTPLRIKGHTFRGTLATQYANCGIGMDVIRMMLGQEKIGVLKHYVTIHSDTMISYMKPILDKCNNMIKNIGNETILEDESATEPSLIPLPNGRCSKDISTGICTHADTCYSCRMFHPSIEYIEIYKKQLQDAENNISIAELHGYDRIKEINMTTRDNILKILKLIGEIDNE